MSLCSFLGSAFQVLFPMELPQTSSCSLSAQEASPVPQGSHAPYRGPGIGLCFYHFPLFLRPPIATSHFLSTAAIEPVKPISLSPAVSQHPPGRLPLLNYETPAPTSCLAPTGLGLCSRSPGELMWMDLGHTGPGFSSPTMCVRGRTSAACVGGFLQPPVCRC